MRSFNARVTEAIADINRLDDHLYSQIKAMSESEVEEFLRSLPRQRVSEARVIIEFIRNSSDLEICRLTLIAASFKY